MDSLRGLTSITQVFLQKSFQTLVTKLLLMNILCFVDAIGVYEERLSVHVFHLFAFKLHFRPQSDGRVRLHLHVFTIQQRWVMTCITEFHVARLQVNQSDKHRHKHALLVVFHQCVVQSCSDGVGRQSAIDQRTEHARHLCHKQGCRNTLSTDVTHTEIQHIV